MIDSSLDRRVRRTHQLLSDALIDLTLTQGYDTITIRDITDHADVAYATFFRHFDDKDDLLHMTLNTLIEAIEGLTYEHTDTKQAFSEGYAIFLHVQEHSNLYRLLLDSQGAHHILEKLKHSIANNMLDACIPFIKSSLQHVPPSIITYQHASSIISLVSWWLAYDMEISVDEMATYYLNTVIQPYFDVEPLPKSLDESSPNESDAEYPCSRSDI